jgi:mannose-6-phosphate isomerase-like protein (cupin superfamily)
MTLKSYHWIQEPACGLLQLASMRSDEEEPVSHENVSGLRPVIARPGEPPIAAVGASLVVREWTMPGPYYMHVHRFDDEAWHVLEGSLRFVFPDGEIDAPAGTTVFVPAGVAHTYRVVEPSRYLIILTPRIEALIARLLRLPDGADLVPTLEEFDTVMAGERA